MNEEFEYLSDEELQKLINETESAGLLQAPPDFEASVLKRIEEKEKEKAPQPISFEEKKKQYSRFKFQVCMAMAAAILFMVVAPFIASNDSFTGIREAAIAITPQKKSENTKYISELFGNRVISETISKTGFNTEDE